MANANPTLSPIDLRLRVVALALEPGLALARLSGLSLDDLQSMVATGYFRQWRARGLSLRGIAWRLHKSLRTTATLSKKAGNTDALTPLGKRIAWRRKLAARVADAGAVPRKKLAAVIRGEPRKEVELEIEQLLEEGVLALSGSDVKLAVHYFGLLDADVEVRLDSLRHFLDAVTQAVFQRFFAGDPSSLSLARVLSFRADAKQLAKLRDSAYASIRDGVLHADAEAGPDACNASLAFCISETPPAFMTK